MRITDELPNRTRCIENCWVPMSDGCRFAARIWLPDARDLSMSKGGWIGESQWPSPSITTLRLALAPGRLALSTRYWPMAWPMPEPVTQSLHTGASTLELPIRTASAADGDLPYEGYSRNWDEIIERDHL